MSLVTWTATGANKLEEYELVVRGSAFKLEINGCDFNEWMKKIETHAEQMSFENLFTCGRTKDDVLHPVHDLFATETYFFNKI